MAPISEQRRNLRFLFLVIVLITIPCYCLGFVVLNVANRVNGIEALPTEVAEPTQEPPTETIAASITPELEKTATQGTRTITVTSTVTLTKTRFLTPTATMTLTPTVTNTSTATATSTPTNTATSTLTPTATQTPTESPTPTEES